MDKRVKLVIAEDEVSTRNALKRTLGLMPEAELIGLCQDGQEALELCLQQPPDVLLTDVMMPRLNGIELMRKLLKVQKDVKVVILTVQEDDDTVFESFRAGALGYILKTSTPPEIVDAIRLAAKGESKITPKIATRVIGDFRRLNSGIILPEVADQIYDLSERESQILAFVAEGKRNKEIATTLGLAEKTIKNHVSNIMRAMQVNSRTEAAMKAPRSTR